MFHLLVCFYCFAGWFLLCLALLLLLFFQSVNQSINHQSINQSILYLFTYLCTRLHIYPIVYWFTHSFFSCCFSDAEKATSVLWSQCCACDPPVPPWPGVSLKVRWAGRRRTGSRGNGRGRCDRLDTGRDE